MELPEIPLTPISNRQIGKKKTTLNDAPTAEYKELSQYFTEPAWAMMIVDLCAKEALADTSSYIIEPSAGKGSFSRWLRRKDIACELHPDLAQELDLYSDNVYTGNFFDLRKDEGILAGKKLRLAIGNPPYERNNDVRFVQHAFRLGAEQVVMIMQTKFINTRLRMRDLWQYVYCQRIITLPRTSIIKVGEHGPQRDYAVFDMVRRVPGEQNLTKIIHWG